MKLYTDMAPNPMRVNVFIAEKGIEIPTERVAILDGETRKAPFTELNPLGELPVLELDDGTCLTESIAICRFLESRYPTPPLLGATPEGAARVEMWNRRMELRLMGVVGDIGLHTFALFKDKIEQQPAYADSQRRLLGQRWEWLDGELSDGRTWVCDDSFSVADITGAASLMIAKFAGEEVPAHCSHVRRWRDALSERPSVATSM